MAKTQFFRIATEGATVDGRVIERVWLEQMAAGYNTATYTARINCEHIAGYSPDKPFNAYGSVLSLKAEEFDLTINGKAEKRLGLYAEIDANDQLIAINKAGQKLFTSCEIHPDFAATKKAYLVGLAVTDNPASLATEPLKFAAMSRPNLFTPAEEVQIALADAASIGVVGENGLIAAMTKFFSGIGKAVETPAPVTPPAPVKPANDNATDFAAFANQIGVAVTGAIATYASINDAAVNKISTDLAALTAKLSSTDQQTFTRSPAAGGNGGTATDC